MRYLRRAWCRPTGYRIVAGMFVVQVCSCCVSVSVSLAIFVVVEMRQDTHIFNIKIMFLLSAQVYVHLASDSSCES